MNLIERLENYYDFQCEGGPLKNCVEWIRLKEVVRAYDAAADKFIRKVDEGRAHSHETYRDLTEARVKSREAAQR